MKNDFLTVRPLWQKLAMLVLLVSLVVLFCGLGSWQIQRLGWKKELIASVDSRIHADPVAVPGTAEWPGMDVVDRVYQRVTMTGTFDHSAEAQTLAVTELGSGYWVMTPLQLEAGGTVIVNRGFVPQALREPETRHETAPSGDVVVTGLLRVSEPGGGFLRDNDPETGRWYSRDTEAIARSNKLTGPVAPFFVDAEMDGAETDDGNDAATTTSINAIGPESPVDSAGRFPRAGLTVVTFRNTHLIYALTWFTLAALSGFGLVLLFKDWRKASRALQG